MKLEVRYREEYTGNNCPLEVFLPRQSFLESYQKDKAGWEAQLQALLLGCQAAAGAKQEHWEQEELEELACRLENRPDCPGLLLTAEGAPAVLVYDFA